jgi:transposase
MSARRTFTKEFKLEAVRLLKLGEKPAAQIARELKIPRNRLYKWERELELKGQDAFRGRGRRPTAEWAEVQRLRRALARVTEERDILKKAAGFFRSPKR